MAELNDFPHECHYRYRALIVRWIDGDTVVLDIDLGFGIWKRGEHIRLARVDTPELRGKEKYEGRKVKQAVEWRMPVGTEVLIETMKDRQGKFGRYIAEVFFEADNISDWLLAEGMAEEIKY